MLDVSGKCVIGMFGLLVEGVDSGGLFVPVGYLGEGLGQGVYHYCGAAFAEALDDLVGVVGVVPEAYDDAVLGQVRADTLADVGVAC